MAASSESVVKSFVDVSDIPSGILPPYIANTPYLIGGELLVWQGPKREVTSPVLVRSSPDAEPARQALGTVPKLGEAEAKAALDAAVAAWGRGSGTWPSMGVEKRIQCVENFLQKMIIQRDVVTKLLMWEIGKTLADSEKEFDRTITYIRDTIDALKEQDRASSRFQIQEGVISQVRRNPIGICLLAAPFNYPLNEAFCMLFPALIMGNTCIFKPAKFGTILFQPLMQAFRDSFPAGAINVLYGEGRALNPPILASGLVDVLGVIGSSGTARSMQAMHPKPQRLRMVCGLDAKNPAIILPDADLSLAVKEVLLGSLSFNGQRCTALKIIFVHADVASRFVEMFAAAVKALKMGNPWEKGVQITPLPEDNKCKTLKSFVEDAIKFGAQVMNEGGAVEYGNIFCPAVLFPCNSQMKVWEEEQFGPIVPIVPYSDIEQPLNYIRDSSFGQQASIFSTNPATIAKLADELVNQVTRVNLNAQCQRGPDSLPFGGRKDSAVGTLSITDALRSFSIRSCIATKATDENKALIREILKDRLSSSLSTDFIL